MRYLDPTGISPTHPHLAPAYARACGADFDEVGCDPRRLTYNDTVLTGPWSDWSFLPAYINVEVIPDNTSPTRTEPLRVALRARNLPTSYFNAPPKTKRAKGYEAYHEAKRWADEMEALFARAPRIEVGKKTAPYEVVDDVTRGREVLAHIARQPAASYDYETNGLDPRLITKRALALADARNSYYLVEPVTRALQKEMHTLLRDTSVQWRASNIKYDLGVSACWNGDFPTDYAPVFDTQVMHWLLEPDAFQHGLKYITKQVLKRDVLALDDIGGPDKYFDLPYDTQALYAAAGDARNSYDLVDVLSGQLHDRGLHDLYTRIEQPVTPVLAEMELEGLPLSRAKLVELAYEYEQRALRIRAELKELGFDGNPNADVQIARYLFQDLELPILVQTKTTKRPSVALDVLRMLRLRLEGTPDTGRGLRAVRLFIEWSEVDKALNTFLLPPLQSGLSTFWFALQQTAVKTGRLSTKPNAQNWPDKLRDICAAPEGYEFTDADYGQIEPRIAAHLSHDPRMLSVFRGELGDIDAYQALGMDMGFPLDRLGKHSALRKNIKTVYLAEQYGGSAPKIQLIALRQGEFIPLQQCRELQRGIHEARPVFYSWRTRYVERTRRNGGVAVDPLFNRQIDKRRQLNAIDPGARDAAEREVMNWPMQTGAGGVIKLSMPAAQRLHREAGGSMCVAPNTRVLTADLRWKCIGDVRVGEQLLTVDEESGPSRRRLRLASVIGRHSSVREAYRIHLADGTSLVCSKDHPWLVGGDGGHTWRTVEQLQRASKYNPRSAPRFRKLAGSWEFDTSREAGWLAGFFDGEGSASGYQVEVSQRPGLLLEQARSLLLARGFRVHDYAASTAGLGVHHDVRHLVLAGGLSENLRFLGSVRPERLVRKFPLEGRQLWSEGVAVLAIEPTEPEELVDITTDTHTFIAEGFVSHNCNMIHDELLGKTLVLTPGQRAEFNAELARSMESVVELSVPLLAEVGVGRTWREAKND